VGKSYAITRLSRTSNSTSPIGRRGNRSANTAIYVIAIGSIERSHRINASDFYRMLDVR
jgi:hypothetical protein